MTTDPEPPNPPEPTVHAAEPASGPSGLVDWWDPELTLEEAAERRREGLDIVVRGGDIAANRRRAREIEALVGTPSRPQFPHTSAGPRALPHFHQHTRSPAGHCFYETSERKARKRS
jgi:hypothetical protein